MRAFSGFCQCHQRFLWVAAIAKVAESNIVDYAGVYMDKYYGVNACWKTHFNQRVQQLSTSTELRIPWETSSYAKLLRKLEITLEDDCVDEAWEAFNNFKCLYGFPKQELVSRMIISLSYSSNPHWLRKAHDLVLVILEDKPNLLHHDSLTRLALTLVRAQLPVPASTILRILLEKFKLPSTDIWNTMFSHLVKTQIGSYLASELLIEYCWYCLRQSTDKTSCKQLKQTSPCTTMFNLVLNSCLRFGSTLKAQQIIELMPRVGVVADANSIIIIARIYEMIGQRDELKNLKRHIDGVSSAILNRHYCQFYDSLLNLHFKYNDLDAAAELVLDLYRRSKSCQSFNGSFTRNNRSPNPCLFQVGSRNLRTGYKIVVDPEKLRNEFFVDAGSHSGLALIMDGKLVPSNKAIAKLINGYVKERKVSKLSNLLISIEKEMVSTETSLSSGVMNACIQLGWLETAHDILDDLESAAVPIGTSMYASLLKAYDERNMLEESKLLLKQMRKVGLYINLSDEHVISSCLLGDGAPFDIETPGSHGKSFLVEFLDREAREEDALCPLIYEFNSSILFFCKAKMMEDALKTFKRMQQRNVQPTIQTFFHLVNGYSSLKMYRQITILWGDIRRRLEGGVLTAHRDLFECLLWNFLRGGYFERVMEIFSYMLKHNMYIDKWKYKREFLKFHKDLYRSLKASNARTDAQSKRLEHVRAFRRWIGINQKS